MRSISLAQASSQVMVDEKQLCQDVHVHLKLTLPRPQTEATATATQHRDLDPQIAHA